MILTERKDGVIMSEEIKTPGSGSPMEGPGGPGPGPGGPPSMGYEEKRPETDWILTESQSYPQGIVLYAGSLPAAPEGKALMMTVDGIPTTIAPGVYPGKVELTVYTLTNVPRSQGDMAAGDFRTSLYIMDGKAQPTGLESLSGSYTLENGKLSGIDLRTDLDDFNGVIVAAEHTPDAPLEITNSCFRLRGSGTSEGKGAAVNVVGKAKAKLTNCEFWDYGTATAIMANGQANVEVDHCVIYGARDFTKGKLCPWVLGINGSNRLTNAIDRAQVYYHDSIVVAQSWAALSTDAGAGVRLVGERLFSGIGRLEPYDPEHAGDYTAAPELGGRRYGFYLGNSAIGECGYINYADTGFHNSFKDVTFYTPDYLFILSTSNASIDVSGDSTLYSGRFGILMHKNHGGGVTLTGGRAYAERALYLIKAWADTDPDGCYPSCTVDGTEVTLGENGVLYQLMTSDDVGLTPGGDSVFTVPELEQDMSRIAPLPDTYKTQKKIQGFPPHIQYPVYVVDGQEVTVKEDEKAFLAAHPDAQPLIIDASYHQPAAQFTLKNTAVTGDIFNGVYARIQALEVTLENASLTGRISSAYTYHVDENNLPCAPGTTYRKSGKEDEHLGIGRVGNTPAPAINNPVQLTLQNGAVWTPAGKSYLDALTVDASSKILGTVTVDGQTVTLPGSYQGKIVVEGV